MEGIVPINKYVLTSTAFSAAASGQRPWRPVRRSPATSQPSPSYFCRRCGLTLIASSRHRCGRADECLRTVHVHRSGAQSTHRSAKSMVTTQRGADARHSHSRRRGPAANSAGARRRLAAASAPASRRRRHRHRSISQPRAAPSAQLENKPSRKRNERRHTALHARRGQIRLLRIALGTVVTDARSRRDSRRPRRPGHSHAPSHAPGRHAVPRPRP